MYRGVSLCLLFCLTAADLLNTRFPERYTAVYSTNGQGQQYNSTLVSNGKITVGFASLFGATINTFSFKENMTTYTIGVPGLDKDKCSGVWALPTDPVLDFFGDANKKARLSGKCRTGTFSFGLLWRYAPDANNVMEICTNLLADEPRWAKANVTYNGVTYSSEMNYYSFSTKVDSSVFTLPSSCYLAVNSREHPLKIPSVWSARLSRTRPEYDHVINDTVYYVNKTTNYYAVQDAQGRNVVIDGYAVYDVLTEFGKNWDMYFPENKTMYSGYGYQNCSCTSDTSSFADPTVSILSATKDERGIEAVYTGVPCEVPSNGFIFGYWYNGIMEDTKYCIRFDGAEPLGIQKGEVEWKYVVFWQDKDVSGVVQLPERCYNTQCHHN